MKTLGNVALYLSLMDRSILFAPRGGGPRAPGRGGMREVRPQRCAPERHAVQRGGRGADMLILIRRLLII